MNGIGIASLQAASLGPSLSTIAQIFFFIVLCLVVVLALSIQLFWNLPTIRIGAWRYTSILFDFGGFLLSILIFLSTMISLEPPFILTAAILLTFFLPGYSILRFIGFNARHSVLEWPVLSFAVSSAIMPSVLFLQLRFFEVHQLTTLLSIVLICMLAPIRAASDWYHGKQASATVWKFDIGTFLLLSSITITFMFGILTLYPNMTGLFGLDIIRHYSSSLLLLGAPIQYNSAYPWFHALWAIPHLLANPSAADLLTSLACLSLIFIFAFYVMARAFLAKVNQKMASVATVLFFLTSGLGWLLLVVGLPNLVSHSPLQLISLLYDASYWDIGSGQASWAWFWYRPMTHAFTLVFTLLFIARSSTLSSRHHLFVCTILTTSLGFVHVPELVLTNLILLALALVVGDSPSLRIRDSAAGALAGSTLFILGSFILDSTGSVIQWSFNLTLVMALAISAAAFVVSLRSPSSLVKVAVAHASSVRRPITSILLAFYCGSILAWLQYPGGFSATNVSGVYFVPAMIFPVLLGVSGILALLSLRNTENHFGKHLLVFLTVGAAIIVLGKAASYLNLLYELGYGERRFMPLLFSMSCILGAMFLTPRILRVARRSKRKASVILLVILVGGFASTTLTYGYWASRLPSTPVESGVGAIAFMSNLDNRGFDTPILTLTDQTRREAEYIPTSYLVNRYRLPIWESPNPEIPLILLNSESYLPAYVVLSDNDLQLQMTEYQANYFSRHIPWGTQVAYSDNDTLCLQLPTGSPPSIESQTVVVKGTTDDYLLVMDMLSMGNYSYTTSVPYDMTTILRAETVLLAGDNSENLEILYSIMMAANNGSRVENIVIFCTLGIGPYGSTVLAESPGTTTVESLVSEQGSFQLPSPVTVPRRTVNESSAAFAWYVGPSGSSPLAVQTIVGSTRIVYVDLSPLLDSLEARTCLPSEETALDLEASNLDGDMIIDCSANGNNGTIFGSQEVLSSLGPALSFDSSSDYISVNASESLNIVGPLSIEAWVQPTNPQDGFAILSKKLTYNSKDGLSFLFDGSSFYLNFGDGENFYADSVPYGQLSSGGWYHLFVTYNLTRITFYVNGIEIGSILESATIEPNSLPILFGKRQDDTWQFHGLLSRVALYNRALTSQQVARNYEIGRQKIWIRSASANILGEMVTFLGFNLPDFGNYMDWVYSGNTGFFEGANFSGYVQIQSTTINRVTAPSSFDVTVMTSNVETSYENVLAVDFSGIGEFSIRSRNVSISSGIGFYSWVSLVDPTIVFSQGTETISIQTSDINTTIVTDGFSMSLGGKVHLLARVPLHFEAEGDAYLSVFYSLFESFSSLRCEGHNLHIDGQFSFDLVASDTYTFLTQIDIQGSIRRNPPLLQWDETQSIVMIVKWTLPVLLPILFWTYRPTFVQEFLSIIKRLLGKRS